jgi:AP2-associated kinase
MTRIELTSGGGIIDLLNKRLRDRLKEIEILNIFTDVCEVSSPTASRVELTSGRRRYALSPPAAVTSRSQGTPDGGAPDGKAVELTVDRKRPV